jgi:hypothetical protein
VQPAALNTTASSAASQSAESDSWAVADLWAHDLTLLSQIYSRCFSLQIHFLQRGHRCGGGRAMSSRMAWRTAGNVGRGGGPLISRAREKPAKVVLDRSSGPGCRLLKRGWHDFSIARGCVPLSNPRWSGGCADFGRDFTKSRPFFVRPAGASLRLFRLRCWIGPQFRTISK